MSSDVTTRDLLICQLVCERGWLTESELVEVVRKWKLQPSRALFDMVRDAAELSSEQLNQMRGQIDSQITETCIDPQTTRLRALPPAVRRVLAGDTLRSDTMIASMTGELFFGR